MNIGTYKVNELSCTWTEVQGFSDNRLIKQSDDNRENILKLQEVMLNMDDALTGESLDKVFPLIHHFAPHVYAREMHLPKGHAIVGKIHKHAHLNFLMKGRVSVSTEEGSKEITAPCIFTSYAGTKRAVYAHEDTTWITVHVTDKTDLSEIEDDIIANNFVELDKLEDK